MTSSARYIAFCDWIKQKFTGKAVAIAMVLALPVSMLLITAIGTIIYLGAARDIFKGVSMRDCAPE